MPTRPTHKRKKEKKIYKSNWFRCWFSKYLFN